MDKYLFEIIGDIGICDTGKRYMRKEVKDINFLIKMWKRWPEYHVEHSEKVAPIYRKYLSKEDKQMLSDNSIYFDANISSTVNSDTIFVSGKSSGIFEVLEWSVMKFYIFDESEIEIRCQNNSIVNIECYNKSKIKVNSLGKTQIKIFQYDESLVASSAAKIEKRTYERGGIFNGKEVAIDYEL